MYQENVMDLIKEANILSEKDTRMLENTKIGTRYYCYHNDWYYSIKSKGFTFLHHLIRLACKYPELGIVISKYLKLYPEEINKVNDKGWTALHIAAINRENNIIRILTENGADINMQNNNGDTALMLALTCSRDVCLDKYETVKLLICSDINVKNNYGMTALMCAIRYYNCGTFKTVKLMLKNEADINVKDNFGRTAFMYAIKYIVFIRMLDRIEIMKLLLISEGKSVINVKDNYGCTALMHAFISCGSFFLADIVNFLLENGANPNVKNNGGFDILAYAQDRLIYYDSVLGKLLLEYDMHVITSGYSKTENDVLLLSAKN